jgi:hypothetical protein
MRLSKNLFQPRPYAQGYTADGTPQINTEEGILRIGGACVSDPIDFFSFPKTINLVAQLVPIFRHEARIEGCITHDLPTPFRPCLVYDSWGDLGKNGQCERIQVVLKSMKSSIENSHDFVGRVLYEKAFQCQNASVILKKWLDSGQVIVSPPGVKGGEPLWTYGGYYRPGCALEDIEQIVFTLVPKGQTTTVFPTRLSHWMMKGLQPWGPPHSSQATVFVDSIPKRHSQNLKADMNQGAISLVVPYGVDEAGVPLEITYYSNQVELVDSALGTVDITLTQRI